MAVRTNSDVADKVRGIAAERRISQGEIAETLNLSRMAISRRVNGLTPFTAEELIKLGALMRTPVAAFFGESVPASSQAPSPGVPHPGERASSLRSAS